MAKKKEQKDQCSLSFQAVNIDSLFPVLDALAWLDLPLVKQVAQFAGIDPRTAGKLLRNSLAIGIAQKATELAKNIAAAPKEESVKLMHS